MTEVDINDIKVGEGEWRKYSDFACNKCGGPAYLNPHTNRIWGCMNCKFTTASVSIYFRPRGANNSENI